MTLDLAQFHETFFEESFEALDFSRKLSARFRGDLLEQRFRLLLSDDLGDADHARQKRAEFFHLLRENGRLAVFQIAFEFFRGDFFRKLSSFVV